MTAEAPPVARCATKVFAESVSPADARQVEGRRTADVQSAQGPGRLIPIDAEFPFIAQRDFDQAAPRFPPAG